MDMSTATQYNTRDSATSALRKIGIMKSDYNDFIVRRDGIFYTDIEGAKKFVAKNPALAAKTAPVPVAKAEKPAKVTKAEVAAEKTGAKVSVSSLIREAIIAGASNQDVWDKFGPNGLKLIGENHRHYGSWYRCELRRKGYAV